VKFELSDELYKDGDSKMGTRPLLAHVAHLGGRVSIPRGMTRPVHLPLTSGEFSSPMCPLHLACALPWDYHPFAIKASRPLHSWLMGVRPMLDVILFVNL
jgi:hypothetical protein